jgi:hypothetical protein
MTTFFHNVSGSYFARFAGPKSSPLRDAMFKSPRGNITIRVTHVTSTIGATEILNHHPLVVTTSRPQANMRTAQNSVTSLNSQGRAVTF